MLGHAAAARDHFPRSTRSRPGDRRGRAEVAARASGPPEIMIRWSWCPRSCAGLRDLWPDVRRRARRGRRPRITYDGTMIELPPPAWSPTDRRARRLLLVRHQRSDPDHYGLSRDDAADSCRRTSRPACSRSIVRVSTRGVGALIELAVRGRSVNGPQGRDLRRARGDPSRGLCHRRSELCVLLAVRVRSRGSRRPAPHRPLTPRMPE